VVPRTEADAREQKHIAAELLIEARSSDSYLITII